MEIMGFNKSLAINGLKRQNFPYEKYSFFFNVKRETKIFFKIRMNFNMVVKLYLIKFDSRLVELCRHSSTSSLLYWFKIKFNFPNWLNCCWTILIYLYYICTSLGTQRCPVPRGVIGSPTVYPQLNDFTRKLNFGY